MKTPHALAAALAIAVGGAAHAASITATASAASALPATVPVTQNLVNGDFLILANLVTDPAGHVTGDGVDEHTRWSFDFNGQPGLAQFLADGQIVSATMSITLHSKFFVEGVGPPGAITYPNDGITGVFPLWNLSGRMTGVGGQYSRATFTTDLLVDPGMSGADLMNWLTAHGNTMPMIFADDAIVVDSALTLVSAPIPEPGTWAMLLAGLAAVGAHARRRAARRG